MKFSASDLADRAAISVSTVLLDGKPQDVRDAYFIDEFEGVIRGFMKPVRLVEVGGGRALATWEKRGDVRVVPSEQPMRGE
jgi:hypothetical protein